jgi:hypothetical protein
MLFSENLKLKTGTCWKVGSRFFIFGTLLFSILTIFSCALTATRPTQEMSDTTAAIRAAKEVQADTLAPELYRQANEWFFRARNEYKFKNFSFADEYAKKAKKFAEQAEFEALRNGGNRTDVAPVDQSMTVNQPPGSGQPPAAATPQPYAYPTPEGTPADVYDERKKADDERRAAEQAAREKAESQAVSPPTDTPAVLQGPTITVPNATATGTATGTTTATPAPAAHY